MCLISWNRQLIMMMQSVTESCLVEDIEAHLFETGAIEVG